MCNLRSSSLQKLWNTLRLVPVQLYTACHVLYFSALFYFTVKSSLCLFVKHFFKIHISKQLDRNLCPMNKPKATVSFQASKLSTCLYIGQHALSCNINLSTQQTTKPHMNAAALTPSVSVTSTLPSASSSMSLWMLRMASKLSREFSSLQSSSSIPHSSEERKQYVRYATETPLKLHNFAVTKQAAYKGI